MSVSIYSLLYIITSLSCCILKSKKEGIPPTQSSNFRRLNLHHSNLGISKIAEIYNLTPLLTNHRSLNYNLYLYPTLYHDTQLSVRQETIHLQSYQEETRKKRTRDHKMSASITAKEVKDHASPDNGLYIIIDNAVYSMAEFADEHPGGAKILKRVGGKGIISILSFPINPL